VKRQLPGQATEAGNQFLRPPEKVINLASDRGVTVPGLADLGGEIHTPHPPHDEGLVVLEITVPLSHKGQRQDLI
jgi:hypothetical protein